MEYLDEISNLLRDIIRLGTIVRISYCFVMLIVSQDDSSTIKRRIINTIKFLVVSETVWAIKALIIHYFT